MSWNLFKVNMLMYMNNPRGVVAFPQYAAKLCIRIRYVYEDEVES